VLINSIYGLTKFHPRIMLAKHGTVFRATVVHGSQDLIYVVPPVIGSTRSIALNKLVEALEDVTEEQLANIND
jgi:hypothetical protein